MGEYHLTKCEMEVMDIVWRRGRVTVQDVVDGLERPLAYTTVMTTLKILKSKRGVLRCEKEGRAFVYEPLVSREEVSRSMTLELKEQLFGGSVKSLLLNLLENESLSKDDIDDLKQAIHELEADE
ncbi:MAG: BlaI/MecI/CopY family transcriptional regulator [Planctomycetaceae bacterium]|nr:BlaI/MecI/CopY family transcriptional regulator [Planctomycetaceae bacterium]